MYSALQCESSLNDKQNLGLYPYIKHVSNIGRLIFWKTLSVYSENHNSIFDFAICGALNCVVVVVLASAAAVAVAAASRTVTLRFKLHC